MWNEEQGNLLKSSSSPHLGTKFQFGLCSFPLAENASTASFFNPVGSDQADIKAARLPNGEAGPWIPHPAVLSVGKSFRISLVHIWSDY
jgi:hypothetical protein